MLLQVFTQLANTLRGAAIEAKPIGMSMDPPKPLIRRASRLNFPVLGNQHVFERCEIMSNTAMYILVELNGRKCGDIVVALWHKTNPSRPS